METNKQWKRIPFDIELAKKIQSGEVEGRIVSRNFLGFDKIVDFICETDGIYLFHVLNCDLPSHTPIIAGWNKDGKLVQHPHMDRFGKGMPGSIVEVSDWDMNIELPEETECTKTYHIDNPSEKTIEAVKKLRNRKEEGLKELDESVKHEFKPFDKVLVRHYNVSLWQPAFF